MHYRRSWEDNDNDKGDDKKPWPAAFWRHWRDNRRTLGWKLSPPVSSSSWWLFWRRNFNKLSNPQQQQQHYHDHQQEQHSRYQTYSAAEAVVTVPKRLGKRILGRFTIPLREMSDKEETFLVGHVMSLTCFHDERTDQHKMHPIARMGLQLDFWWISGPCVEFLCLDSHEVIISGGAAWPVWAQCRAPPSCRALQTWRQSMESLKKKKVAQKGLKWTIMGTCSSSK